MSKSRIQRAYLNWSWRSPLYTILIEGRELFVVIPKRTEQSGANLFSFEWSPDQIYSVLRNIFANRIEFKLNNVPIAEIVPRISSRRNWRLRQHEHVPIEATGGIGTWVLSSSSFLGMPTGSFTIFNDSKRRECHWIIRSCSLGGPSAKMLIRRSSSESTTPLFLSIAIATLLAFGSSAGA